MKKVILGAVALMIGGMVFAQTETVAPAPPTNAQVLIPAPGVPASANAAHAIQNGDDNKVAVSQVGTRQGAYSDQDNGSGVGGNQARITQTGNQGPLSGRLNMAEVYQRGTENQSTQSQYGNRNEALTQQGNIDDGSDGNLAWIRQGSPTAQRAEDNKAQVIQNGDDNQARTEQRYDNSEALTTQSGNLNYADIFQDAAPDSSEGHEAEILQTGDSNDAWINQVAGAGAGNEATAIQDGTGNLSYQQQESTAVSNGSATRSNNAYVTQGIDSRANPMATGQYLDLLTVDVINNGPLNSGATNAKAFQFQVGDDNEVAALQFGDGNYSEQRQNGEGNDAFVMQNAFGNPAGNSNYAKQNQIGDDNEAAIGQNGMDHNALQAQTGNRNKALSTQRGHDNDTNIHQIGDDNWASTAQRGQCNDALVVQYDGQWAKVEQNLVGGLPAGNNTANIFQAGPGGGAVIDCDFDAMLLTPAQNDIPVFDIPDICPGC